MSKKEQPELERRAAEALAKAEKMPPGRARDEAMAKAKQLIEAMRLRRWLSSKALKPPT